jgi:hypothetical protein
MNASIDDDNDYVIKWMRSGGMKITEKCKWRARCDIYGLMVKTGWNEGGIGTKGGFVVI